MNGVPNPARPFAILAMIVLCTSLTIFFIQFAQQLEENKRWKRIIIAFGALSMLSAVFIFTSLHDLMTTVSSIFGVVVVLRIIRVIYKGNLILFKIGGIVCLILLALNNLIYYSEYYIQWLPLIQKITFVLVLTWISGLNYKLAKEKFSKYRKN